MKSKSSDRTEPKKINQPTGVGRPTWQAGASIVDVSNMHVGREVECKWPIRASAGNRLQWKMGMKISSKQTRQRTLAPIRT